MLRVLPKHRNRANFSRRSLDTRVASPHPPSYCRKSTSDVPSTPNLTPFHFSTPHPSPKILPFESSASDAPPIPRNPRLDRHVLQGALNRAARPLASHSSERRHSISSRTSSFRIPSPPNVSKSPSPCLRPRSPPLFSKVSYSTAVTAVPSTPPSPGQTPCPTPLQTPPPTPIFRNRRPRDRSTQPRHLRRHAPPPPPTPRSSTDDPPPPQKTHSILDSPRRRACLRPQRRLRFRISDDVSRPSLNPTLADQTPWSHPTPDASIDSLRLTADRPTALSHHSHSTRSDRRHISPPTWRDEPSIVRDRSAKRLTSNGARWRGLLARKDLVDGKADVYCTESNEDITPRSSLDIEEATIEEAPSIFSWDDPPSASVRGWRSNHSLSYRPKPNGRPRHIRVIGRQFCINDLTDIVDASNEPCVSYDRQIFDPVSKLWTYVEASQPSSSPWELRAVGSPVTCSVSGTEEGVSTIGRGISAPPTTTAFSVSDVLAQDESLLHSLPEASLPITVTESSVCPDARRNNSNVMPSASITDTDSAMNLRLSRSATVAMTNSDHVCGNKSIKELVINGGNVDASIPTIAVSLEQEALQAEEGPGKRRNSSPPCAAPSNDDDEVVKRAFLKAREQWLGYSRKSVYGPANLEAVIFASEMEEGTRRASMV